MPKHVRLVLLPLVVALPFIATPVQAVSTGTGNAATASQGLSKKQLKQQRKLAKQCAKLSAGKMKKASKRAKYQKLCAQPTGSTPDAAGGGAGPVVDEQDGGAPGEGTSNGGAGNGSNPAGGASNPGGGGSNAGGPSTDAPGQQYLDELLDLPPIFTPPTGGGEDQTGDGVQIPELDVVTPTNDVPEPGSIALLGLGLVGLGLARRRQR